MRVHTYLLILLVIYSYRRYLRLSMFTPFGYVCGGLLCVRIRTCVGLLRIVGSYFGAFLPLWYVRMRICFCWLFTPSDTHVEGYCACAYVCIITVRICRAMVTVRVHMYLLARFPLSPPLEGLLCVRMRMCWLVRHRRYLRLCILTPYGYVRGGILCVCMRVCWLVTLLRVFLPLWDTYVEGRCARANACVCLLRCPTSSYVLIFYACVCLLRM